MLGGSSAYGYGTTWDKAIPAILERRLAGRNAGPFRKFGVINLGYNNEGAYSFTFTLKDYQSLDYDLVCLYEGYNDVLGDWRAPNLSVTARPAGVRGNSTGARFATPWSWRDARASRWSSSLNRTTG
jgi:hypothetical protein